MVNILNFYVYFVWTSCEIASRPLKGTEWSEPKTKGNITVIMIPQEKSGCDDSDVIVAVKSDYKVLSQDMQLINLVVQDNTNHSKTGCGVTSTKRPSIRCDDGIKGPKTENYFQPQKKTAIIQDNNSKLEKQNSADIFKPLGLNDENNEINNNRSLLKFNSSSTDKNVRRFSEMSNTSSKLTEENGQGISDIDLNIPQVDEYGLFLKLLDVPLNKENDVKINEISFTTEDSIRINQPVSTIGTTSIEGALEMLNKLKRNLFRSNTEGNASTIASNYSLSVCKPFFVEPNSLASTDRANESKAIACSTEDNVNDCSYNKSSLLAHLSPRDIGSIQKSNSNDNIIQSQSELIKEADAKLASLLNEIEENPNIGLLAPSENQQPESQGVEKPNEATICTTTIVIVKCNPVQDNKVFEQISEMANALTTVTKCLEVKNPVGDIELRTEPATTETVPTECFSVSPNGIQQMNNDITTVAQRKEKAKKITLEPPVECASRINVRERQTCETFTEQDIGLEEDDVTELPFVKDIELLAYNHEREKTMDVPIVSEVKYRLPDTHISSTLPSVAAQVFGNYASARVKDSTLQPLLLEHEDIGKMLLFPPFYQILKDNYEEKNSYFDKGPSFRTGMNIDNNNQCDSKGSARIDNLNPQVVPDIPLTGEIKSTTKLQNDTQFMRNFQIISTEKRNENVSKLYTISPSVNCTEQHSYSNETKYTLNTQKPIVLAETDQPVYKTASTISVTEHKQTTQCITNITSTEHSLKTTENKFDVFRTETEHNLNEFDATTTIITDNISSTCSTFFTFPLNKTEEIYTAKTYSENKVTHPPWVTINQNKTTCSTNNYERLKTLTSECFYKFTRQDKYITSLDASLIKTTKKKHSIEKENPQGENKYFNLTELISSRYICNVEPYTTKSPLRKYTIQMKNTVTSPITRKPVKIPAVTIKQTRTTNKGNSDKVRNLLLNNLPFGLNPKYQSNKKQKSKNDIHIPVDSVKEIVIQIVQNTKAPEIDYKTNAKKV